jgi:PAS domain S-box-containing protein
MQYSKSEEWYRCLFEQASDLIVIHDMDGIIVNASDSLFSRLGYAREEMLGMNWRLFMDPEELKRTPLRMKQLQNGEHIFSERRCICKDGTIVELEANVRKMSNDLVLVVCRDVTRQRTVERELHEAEIKFGSIITDKKLLELEIMDQKVQEQKKITRAVIKAQEKERTKIGQELHDNVNQILASARMYLTASCEDKRDNKEILMQESIALIDSAIHELRLLARNEITPQGKLDLRQLIQPLVDNLNAHAVIQTKFDYCMTVSPIDTDLKLNIYRIVQEQITNILKHSCAASVHIKLNGDDRFICLSVTDDGKGFETAGSRKGVGITNIMNRIESFNGEFSIQSSPGNGCKLSVRFPR